MKKKIFITGVAGFIGSRLAEIILSKKNYEVFGIDNLNDYYSIKLKQHRLEKLNKYAGFSFQKNDLNDVVSNKEIFKKFRPHFVVNLAAQAGVRYSKENPVSYVNSNIDGFLKIISLSNEFNVEKFIYASSSSVYGSSKKIPFKESEKNLAPVSLYGSTKLSNENIANLFYEKFNLNCIGLRFFTVYGPRGRPDMAYFHFANKIKNNEPITVYNEGKMSRDMTYVDDICDGIIKSMKIEFKKPEIFNLGNNRPINLLDLINFLEKSFGKKANIFYETSIDEIKNTQADISKAVKILNYHPKTSFEDGMNLFYDWFIKYEQKK